MYCKKCGAQNNDEAVFCRACGDPLVREAVEEQIDRIEDQAEQFEDRAEEFGAQADAPAQQTASGFNAFIEKIKGLSKEKLIGLGAAALAVLVGLILIIALLCGGWKSTAKGYAKAVGNINLVKAASYLPSKYVKAYLKDEDMTKSEWKKELKEDAKEIKEYQKIAGAKLVKTEIVGYKEHSKDQIKKIKENLKNSKYDLYLNITDAKTVYIRYTYKYDDEKRQEDSSFVLIKVGGKWCLSPSSFDF
ncbi:MAG: zinc-ribbon domain-containing protein [Clostridia bacterium]|nr:zinc-ribbon domain-containing protein [Clostridia bacterium]